MDAENCSASSYVATGRRGISHFPGFAVKRKPPFCGLVAEETEENRVEKKMVIGVYLPLMNVFHPKRFVACHATLVTLTFERISLFHWWGTTKKIKSNKTYFVSRGMSYDEYESDLGRLCTWLYNFNVIFIKLYTKYIQL